MGERKLASIQFVSSVEPIVGADRIEKIKVMGWQTIASKGEFHPGDYCVFFEVDSVLPSLPEYEFMAPRNYRVRTMKMRGELSQGLAMPISVLKQFNSQQLTISEGVDVTELLGIKKWEPVVAWYKALEAKGNFPFYVPKTDEIRVQSVLGVLDELKGKPFYATEKVDGSSMTVAFREGEFDVCSRNISIKDMSDNMHWNIVRKYNLQEAMAKAGFWFALQGELCGPKIQGNKLGLKEHDWFIFSVYDIQTSKYFDYKDAKIIADSFGLKFVPILEEGGAFNYTLEELLEKAEGKYATGQQREGIVIRPQTEMHSEALKGRLSFKVLNNKYLLEEQ